MLDHDLCVQQVSQAHTLRLPDELTFQHLFQLCADPLSANLLAIPQCFLYELNMSNNPN